MALDWLVLLGLFFQNVAGFRGPRQLGNANNIDDACKNLLITEKAEVIIIKLGALGLKILTKSISQFLESYKTSNVWPIGSGDVFSAIFAYYWFNNPSDPLNAAIIASKTTAYYVDNIYLPIDLTLVEKQSYEKLFAQENARQLYLAGPFFNLSERWLIEEAYKYLTHAGIKVFSPLHNVGRGLANEVVDKDLDGLNKCEVIFAIVDNLDSGTLFEIGYAVSKNKKIIILNQKETAEDLKVMVGTNCLIEKDFVTAIYKTIWACYEK